MRSRRAGRSSGASSLAAGLSPGAHIPSPREARRPGYRGPSPQSPAGTDVAGPADSAPESGQPQKREYHGSERTCRRRVPASVPPRTAPRSAHRPRGTQGGAGLFLISVRNAAPAGAGGPPRVCAGHGWAVPCAAALAAGLCGHRSAAGGLVRTMLGWAHPPIRVLPLGRRWLPESAPSSRLSPGAPLGYSVLEHPAAQAAPGP